MERRNVEVGRPEVARYTATIRLLVSVYEAKDADEAHEKVNTYIDHLAEITDANLGELTWPEVDWIVQEED